MQPLDFIINNTPRSGIGLSSEKWKAVWAALIRILREIDIFSHPEEVLELSIINPTQIAP